MSAQTEVSPESKLIDLIACEQCDALWARPSLTAGQLARCGRCDAVLGRYPWVGLQGQFALVATATIMFVIANAFPIVVLDMQGIRHGSTLLEAIVALSQQGAAGVAIVAAVTVLICPLLELLIRAWALLSVTGAHSATGMMHTMLGPSLRLLSRVQRWSMMEVYVIGILVTVVKLGSMAQVIPGISIVSFAALTILIGAIRSAGTDAIWKQLELSRTTMPAISDEPDRAASTWPR